MEKTQINLVLRRLRLYLVFGMVLLFACGCAGTPKISQWTPPSNLPFDQVFNAALRAGKRISSLLSVPTSQPV